MKWLLLSLLFVAAFFTGAKVRHHNTTPPIFEVTKERAERSKFFTIRCAPLYVPDKDEPIPRLDGWGNYSWKITTVSDSAQFYFDQGINMYYAFHIIESRASFDKALRFDENCAMAWWGKALAFGPNINDFGYSPPSEALPSSQKAYQLSNAASPIEKALIGAMNVRYSADTASRQESLNRLYKEQMSKVYAAFSGNADVAALYADALMLLHPWDLYNHDFTAKPWTPEIAAVLKSALKLNPSHPGANHYYIHTMEASATPEAALKSAEFLCTAMPGVSHLTHMPSHIYIRTGYYNKGIVQNNKAVSGYQEYLRRFAPVEENIALYSLHNIHMKMNCAQMAGSYAIALTASNDLRKATPSFYLSAPGALGNYVQYLYAAPLFTQIRFGKWAEILKEEASDTLSYLPVLQHFARGIAFSKTGRPEEAKKELALLKTRIQNPSLKEPFTPFSAAFEGATIAENILNGVLAEQEKDWKEAIGFYQNAVSIEDNLIYNEPRDWVLPARQYLGNVLLKAGMTTKALKVFNNDLVINPNNGWSLTGIKEAYRQLNNEKGITVVNKRLNNAWLIRDVEVNNAVF